MARFALCAALSIAVAAVVPAQQSSSYRIDEQSLNAGGAPQAGSQLSSTSYRLSLASLGDPLAQLALTSPGLSVDGSIVGALRPAGEVDELLFADTVTLVWSTEPSIGSYTLYRGDLTGLGSPVPCLEDGISSATTTDADPLTTGSGRFYLVAAANRLGELGTLGTDSAGSERVGSTCP